jgi:hypothetical protein
MMVMRDTLNPGLAQLGAAMPNLEVLPTERMNHIIAHRHGRQARNAPISTRRGWNAASRSRQAWIADVSFPGDIIAGGIRPDLCTAVCRRHCCIESPMYFGFAAVRCMVQRWDTQSARDRLDALLIIEQLIKAVLTTNLQYFRLIPDEKKKSWSSCWRFDIPLIDNDVQVRSISQKEAAITKAFDEGSGLFCPSRRISAHPAWERSGRYQNAEWLNSHERSHGHPAPDVTAEFLESGITGRSRMPEYASNVTVPAVLVHSG